MKVSKKYSSRATKIVLASLLAASMTVPSLASAQAGETVTRSGETTEVTTTSPEVKKQTVIDFTLSPADSEIASFIKGPWTIVSTPGGTFFDPKFDESTLKEITAITVDGKSVLSERNGVKSVYIPVTKDYSDLELSITSSFSKEPAVITIKFNKDAIREEVVQPEPEAEKPDAGLVIDPAKLPDGIYTAKATYLNAKLTGTSSMGSYISDQVVIKVKDGVATADLTLKYDYPAILSINHYVNKQKVEAPVTGKTIDGDKKIFTFPISTIGDYVLINGDIDYSKSSAAASIPATMNPINTHDFNLKIDASTLQSKGTIGSYHATEDKPSVMDTYINKKATIKAVEGGYEVEMSFTEGKYVLDFEVEGETATLVSAHTDAKPSSVYKFTVDSLDGFINSKIHIKVNGLYEMNHDVRLKLEGQALAPFADVEASWAKDYINELYAKGIFAQDSKFNPTNKTERYQFALMVQRAFNFEASDSNKFTDLPSSTEAVSAINALAAEEIIKGNGDNTFAPFNTIKRQDAAIMIHRVLKANGYVDAEGVGSNFADVTVNENSNSYEKEIYEAVNQLADLNILNGTSANTFDPTSDLTREQMAKVLSVLIEVVNDYKAGVEAASKVRP